MYINKTDEEKRTTTFESQQTIKDIQIICQVPIVLFVDSYCLACNIFKKLKPPEHNTHRRVTLLACNGVACLACINTALLFEHTLKVRNVPHNTRKSSLKNQHQFPAALTPMSIIPLP